jgi:hypothetical protein
MTLSDGFLVVDADATINDIEEHVEKLFFMQRNVNWWIGDLITFGEARFGDDIWQAMPMNASHGQMTRSAAQARKYKITERVPGASWTQHGMVASFTPALRKAILRQAVDACMDTTEFSNYIKRLSKEPGNA